MLRDIQHAEIYRGTAGLQETAFGMGPAISNATIHSDHSFR